MGRGLRVGPLADGTRTSIPELPHLPLLHRQDEKTGSDSLVGGIGRSGLSKGEGELYKLLNFHSPPLSE